MERAGNESRPPIRQRPFLLLFPECRLVRDEADRAALWRQCEQVYRARPWPVRLTLQTAPGLAIGFLPWFVAMSALWWGGESPPSALAIFGLTMAACVLSVVLLFRRLYRPILHEAMRRIGAPICPACFYDLRDCRPDPDAPMCPECGSPLTQDLMHAIRSRQQATPDDA